MTEREILQDIIADFNPEKFIKFFRAKTQHFAPANKELTEYNDEMFSGFCRLGEIRFDKEVQKLLIAAVKVNKDLTEKTGKKFQYDKAIKILKDSRKYDAGIFIYYDASGRFRFSLVYEQTSGVKRKFSNFRRFTYYVSGELTNKTFITQLGDNAFSSLNKIKEAFSIEKVSKEFYNSFYPIFEEIAGSVSPTSSPRPLRERQGEGDIAKDFTLLFVIRIIFLGFLQKRKWLGNNDKFIQALWKEYKTNHNGKDKFYERWLGPLFFEALNSPIGRKVAYQNNDFSAETEKNLQMAPYLNGGLFEIRKGIDDRGYCIKDVVIEKFFGFLFSYNFTIEENTLYDQDLELNPEFLGIIFERLVNKENGAIYTPRTEVDFMCRLSLVKWLEKNNTTGIDKKDLYELFFREGGKDSSFDEDQKEGDFSIKQVKELLSLIENLSICDPAVGSGAFPVGMLHVINEIEEKLLHKLNDLSSSPLPLRERQGEGGAAFERKKRIISNSLYGVEVKPWAVWITQLRLWITLFIDAPDKMKNSPEPILPSLDFKIRCGDSLVQRIGNKLFPVVGHAELKRSLKDKITKLKNLKTDFFQNKIKDKWKITQQEYILFNEILEAEIQEKKNKIDLIRNSTGVQQELFFEELEKTKIRKEVPLFETTVNELRKEIEELETERKAIKEEHPLIWNIEFAEIFTDKGGFDIIIGNPPYVRQEQISDPTGKIKNPKEYKDLLREMVMSDFPYVFKKKEMINAQSDLYTYFYIRSLRLLNPNGIHTFICSNSWLDVGYGVWLQYFLLEKARIHFIIDNQAERSFSEADINTIISVIDAPSKKSPEDSLVRFVAFKKPFEEAVFTEILLEIENAVSKTSNEIFRIHPISPQKLTEEGSLAPCIPNLTGSRQSAEGRGQGNGKFTGEYIGDKWGGKYLRAPDIFWTILEKGKNKLVRLGDIAEVRRGFTTGANEFFYLEPTGEKAPKGLVHVMNSVDWSGYIEEEYLKPVIKSPRECSSLLINESKTKYKIFMCNKNKKELKDSKALAYILWGEKQKTKDGIFWNKVPSVSRRTHWYDLGDRNPSIYNFNYLISEIGETFIGTIYVSDNFHQIKTDEKIAIFMNSAIFWLFQNVLGRKSFGGGLLKIQTYELEAMLVMCLKHELTKLFKRPSQSIFEEFGFNSDLPIREQEPKPIPDRKDLDEIVFDAIGLTEQERKEVYWSVCELVQNRLKKAKST